MNLIWRRAGSIIWTVLSGESKASKRSKSGSPARNNAKSALCLGNPPMQARQVGALGSSGRVWDFLMR